MKKLFTLMLAIILLLSAAPVYAEDLGIVMIGPGTQIIPDSIDDMKLGTAYTLDGYATVKPLEFLTVDYFAQFGEKEDYGIKSNCYSSDWSIWMVASYSTSKFENGSGYFIDAQWKESGTSAQFFWLTIDITNRQHKAVNFIDEASVKVVYQDEYEFIGWIRQIDPDVMSKSQTDYGVSRKNSDKADYPNVIVLNPDKTHEIDMMYTGHYVFGCTVPNFVVEDKKSPLRMEIKLGDSELTYYIIR